MRNVRLSMTWEQIQELVSFSIANFLDLVVDLINFQLTPRLSLTPGTRRNCAGSGIAKAAALTCSRL